MIKVDDNLGKIHFLIEYDSTTKVITIPITQSS